MEYRAWIADLQSTLASANGFSEAELSVSREDRVAPSQIARLLASAMSVPLLVALILWPVWLYLTGKPRGLPCVAPVFRLHLPRVSHRAQPASAFL